MHLQFTIRLVNYYIWSIAESWHLGKQIRNTWNVLQCGAGEKWRSAGQIVSEIKNVTNSHEGEKWNTLKKIKKEED